MQAVRDLLRFAVSRFTAADLSFGHGSSNAFDEAAYFVLHTLHLPLDTLDPFLDARLFDAIMKVIERRATDRARPTAYPQCTSRTKRGYTGTVSTWMSA